jgi:hypothetical protein
MTVPVLLCLFLVATFYLLLHGRAMKQIERDHEKIAAIMENFLLSEATEGDLEMTIDKIQSFQSIDHVWVVGNTLFVSYKRGGTVSWSLAENKGDEK